MKRQPVIYRILMFLLSAGLALPTPAAWALRPLNAGMEEGSPVTLQLKEALSPTAAAGIEEQPPFLNNVPIMNLLREPEAFSALSAKWEILSERAAQQLLQYIDDQWPNEVVAYLVAESFWRDRAASALSISHALDQVAQRPKEVVVAVGSGELVVVDSEGIEAGPDDRVVFEEMKKRAHFSRVPQGVRQLLFDKSSHYRRQQKPYLDLPDPNAPSADPKIIEDKKSNLRITIHELERFHPIQTPEGLEKWIQAIPYMLSGAPAQLLLEHIHYRWGWPDIVYLETDFFDSKIPEAHPILAILEVMSKRGEQILLGVGTDTLIVLDLQGIPPAMFEEAANRAHTEQIPQGVTDLLFDVDLDYKGWVPGKAHPIHTPDVIDQTVVPWHTLLKLRQEAQHILPEFLAGKLSFSAARQVLEKELPASDSFSFKEPKHVVQLLLAVWFGAMPNPTRFSDAVRYYDLHLGTDSGARRLHLADAHRLAQFVTGELSAAEMRTTPSTYSSKSAFDAYLRSARQIVELLDLKPATGLEELDLRTIQKVEGLAGSIQAQSPLIISMHEPHYVPVFPDIRWSDQSHRLVFRDKAKISINEDDIVSPWAAIMLTKAILAKVDAGDIKFVTTDEGIEWRERSKIMATRLELFRSIKSATRLAAQGGGKQNLSYQSADGSGGELNYQGANEAIVRFEVTMDTNESGQAYFRETTEDERSQWIGHVWLHGANWESFKWKLLEHGGLPYYETPFGSDANITQIPEHAMSYATRGNRSDAVLAEFDFTGHPPETVHQYVDFPYARVAAVNVRPDENVIPFRYLSNRNKVDTLRLFGAREDTPEVHLSILERVLEIPADQIVKVWENLPKKDAGLQMNLEPYLIGGPATGLEEAVSWPVSIEGRLERLHRSATHPNSFFVIGGDLAEDPVVRAFAGLEDRALIHDGTDPAGVVTQLVALDARSFRALGGLEETDLLFSLAEYAGITGTVVRAAAANAAAMIQYIFERMGVDQHLLATELPAFMVGLEELATGA